MRIGAVNNPVFEIFNPRRESVTEVRLRLRQTEETVIHINIDPPRANQSERIFAARRGGGSDLIAIELLLPR
mgnify:CR=1 FL=1